MAEDDCRIDVWLWRARLAKTRARAADLAGSGVIRLTRQGAVSRLEKASRTVRPGDELVFALAGQISAVRVLAFGTRRGPAPEARLLYQRLDIDDATAERERE
ncbi:MAG TPA: RNA-binding S4 domain-containing protein [Caulobacteraceae bacterium]|nr:RNA-binding S4 domain-containing protein [Caulobacteraceae bacterium]